MRRQRFRAELSHTTSNAVVSRLMLAYDADDVRDFYERCGYVVLDVRSARKKRTTERPANPPWVKDDRAIRSACDFLGITLPVTIKPTNVAGGRHGAHQFRPTGPGVRIVRGRIHGIEHTTGFVHHITVKSWLSVEEASRTLWHELAHAVQAERLLGSDPLAASDPRAAMLAWKTAYRDGTAYEHKPLEREAREYEEFAAEQPLARLV